MLTLGCRIRKEQAATFKDVCAAAGTTANTALKDYVMECIDAQALVKPSGGGTSAEAAQKPTNSVFASSNAQSENASRATQSGVEGG